MKSSPFFKAFVVPVLVALSACSGQVTDTGGRLYTYVDAQGNLVALERGDEQAKQEAVASAPESLEIGPEGQLYRKDESRSLEQEQRDRNRFVVYPGADGQLVQQPLDLVSERKARREQGDGSIELDAEPFIERILAVRADCCTGSVADARELDVGQEVVVDLEAGAAVVQMDGARPAEAFELSGDVARLYLQGFVGPSGDYLYPGVIFLDEAQIPLLVVDRVYQRQYPETWYRFGYYDGEVDVPDGAVYALLYLPYAERTEVGVLSVLPSLVAHYEVPPSALGELVLRAR